MVGSETPSVSAISRCSSPISKRQFDDAAFARIESLEFDQRRFDAQPGVGTCHRNAVGGAEADHCDIAAALLGLLAADRIGEHLAQHHGDGAEEMFAIHRIERMLQQFRECFVDEFGGLQRARCAAGQTPRRHRAQVVVHECGECARGIRIAGAPGGEESGGVVGIGAGHARGFDDRIVRDRMPIAAHGARRTMVL